MSKTPKTFTEFEKMLDSMSNSSKDHKAINKAFAKAGFDAVITDQCACFWGGYCGDDVIEVNLDDSKRAYTIGGDWLDEPEKNGRVLDGIRAVLSNISERGNIVSSENYTFTLTPEGCPAKEIEAVAAIANEEYSHWYNFVVRQGTHGNDASIHSIGDVHFWLEVTHD